MGNSIITVLANEMILPGEYVAISPETGDVTRAVVTVDTSLKARFIRTASRFLKCTRRYTRYGIRATPVRGIAVTSSWKGPDGKYYVDIRICSPPGNRLPVSVAKGGEQEPPQGKRCPRRFRTTYEITCEDTTRHT